MEGSDRASDRVSSRSTASKRGTPNKRWKPDYDNFLTPLLVEQARKGLKCDKSFKRAAFAFAAVQVNARFGTTFTVENVENHYRTLKARWDDATKTITLDPVVAFTYTEAHPAARAFINKPIENYENLRIICGDDYATGYYATSMFSEFEVPSEHEDDNPDNGDSPPMDHASDEDCDVYSTPPVVNSPATSSTPRSQRSNRGPKNNSMMGDLLVVVGEMADAIKNPTHRIETLYTKVMEVEGDVGVVMMSTRVATMHKVLKETCKSYLSSRSSNLWMFPYSGLRYLQAFVEGCIC
ncbi:uncharacterized protein LOC120271588 [Dioscorea cayenensis subsp. rotundata]|uniref:Uncharacterized protein LOC120271588 n=1 Tax=Dioscorea cayennensis subsp. rotundata TaxID=55577 RepID=A0AB40C354_DIOCR|nr:uncharacterized protein LOC120271588 [Dioscorea cayenensis subsp. rotundata]